MWIATAIALLGVLAALVTALATLVTAMRIRGDISTVHGNMSTVNGNPIGAVVEGIAKVVAPEALMNATQVVASRDAHDAEEIKP